MDSDAARSSNSNHVPEDEVGGGTGPQPSARDTALRTTNHIVREDSDAAQSVGHLDGEHKCSWQQHRQHPKFADGPNKHQTLDHIKKAQNN